MKSQGTVIAVSAENAATTAYATATFTPVGEVTDIGEPDGEAAEIDTTHLGSTDMEFLMGLNDNGNIALTGNATTPLDAGHTELFEANGLQESRWIKITRVDGSIRYFKAFVKRMQDIGMSVNGRVPFSSALRISGAVTRVAAP